MPQSPSQSILFEMLRSFTTLAHTLNLSKAVKILGSTRQTLRRHIDILEEIRGEKLFEVHERQYSLTRAGMQSVKEARTLLVQGENWLAGRSKIVDGLALLRYDDEQNHSTYSQQHPIKRVWVDGPPLLQYGLQAWVEAKSHLEHPAMEKISPYLNVYRKHKNSWLCVRVGELSSLAIWLGPVWAKSAIGCILEEDPMSSGADRYTIEIYDRVSQEGGFRLDHVYTTVSRKEGETPKPASYQRLLFNCVFPDGSPAIATLTALTNKVEILGLDLENNSITPEDTLMEFDL